MMAVFTLSNFQESGTIKMMFFAELANTDNSIFNAVRGCKNVGFPATSLSSTPLNAHLRERFWARNTTNSCKANFFYCLRFMRCSTIMSRFAFPRYAHLSTSFRSMSHTKSMSVTKLSKTILFSRFRGLFLTKITARFTNMTSTHICAGFWCMFHTQGRASNRSNIEAIWTKWIEFLKPVLFSCRQKLWNKDIFEDFKGESVGAVLIESPLQLNIPVIIALKSTKVVFTTMIETFSATDVELTCNNAGNTVNARCLGDTFVIQCEHSYHPSYQGGSLEAALCFQHRAVSSCFNTSIIT